MDARLQRRVQRYGWDLAAASYEPLWQAQVASAQDVLLARMALSPGDALLDVACGTGLVAFAAAEALGPAGRVVGVDISERMVDAARQRALERGVANATFTRMDAESLDLPDGGFDAASCALGLMYMPDPEAALREMHRVLRPGGRIGLAVWGEQYRCGWSSLLSIVEAEVASEVCPLFFRMGQQDTLARACSGAGFGSIDEVRVEATLTYHDADEACRAAFVGGPVALAWSRFDRDVRTRVRRRYVQTIEPWRRGHAYRIPGEFVIVTAQRKPPRRAALV